LIFTDASCEMRRATYEGLPILLTRAGAAVDTPSDWLRYQAVKRSAPASTLQTYAETLRLYWNYLDWWNSEERKRAMRENREIPPIRRWDEIDDDFLEEWRNDQRAAGVHTGTINFRMSLVFRFYWWAQTTGRVQRLIGWTHWDESGRADPPPISARVVAGRSKGGVTPVVLTSNLLYPKPGKAKKSHIPTNDEAFNLHATLGSTASEYLAVRNSLMASWAEEAGLRRLEFLALKASEIPSREDIAGLMARGEIYLLDLTVTKGGRPRTVPVTPELLGRTREFIDVDRHELLQCLRRGGRRGSALRVDALFLSRSGRPLGKKGVTNLFTKNFALAGVDGSLHRLRAKFLMDLTEEYFRIEYERNGAFFSRETILLKVAEVAGHKRMDTLRHYLDLVVRRHYDTDGAQREVTESARSLSHVRGVQARLNSALTKGALQQEVAAIIGGDKAAEVAELLCDRLRSIIGLQPVAQ
jgi:integrase